MKGLAPALYVSGEFVSVGGLSSPGFARWNGQEWEPLASRLGSITDMVVADLDGSGVGPESIYAVGPFATTTVTPPINYVARYDFGGWHPLGSGLGAAGRAVVVFDEDGAGPLPAGVFVGGDFVTAGGATANRVARWDNAGWSAVGTGVDAPVRDLVMFDEDGAGPGSAALFAAGDFQQAGGGTALRVARWDGSAWTAVGGGVGGIARALATFDPDGPDPQPAKLIAGGDFLTAGGGPANYIASWNGTAWHALGAGTNARVTGAIQVDPDAGGPAPSELYIRGEFNTAGISSANHVARWNGAAWNGLTSGTGSNNWVVHSFGAFDPDGDGPEATSMFVGGRFTVAGGLEVKRMARWDGFKWSAINNAIDGFGRSLDVFDPDGPGPQPERIVLLSSGTSAGGLPGVQLAAWYNDAWHALPAGFTGGPAVPMCIEGADLDGPGGQPYSMYVGGQFTAVAGVPASSIARWDGGQWHALGSGASNGSAVQELAVYDRDGAGPAGPLLVAGGGFGSIGGISNTSNAAWDGTQWVALGSGVDDEVYALLPVPSASAGVDLIVAGYFENAGGVQATHVARWDGSSWSAMGAGLGNPGPLGGVRELEYLDPDGAGPQPSRIVAAGDFYRGDGPGGVAYWTGEGWLQIGTMVGTPMSLFDIAGGDFGNGFELVACGKQSG
jgi:hypothetical protein